ncbi:MULTISPECIES: hypothetical protein [Azospirillaceae]|uniref:hypothetical protein n=1 Tax=Azospirillaceae TaxID=2829815 RepID=UPI000B7172ED|nr:MULTISPECIES: hypothetical protein [Azospirillaceae]MDG5496965.1 hypothetical protein [Niveispirillum sp. BGYR6]SNS83653.1 hypothetical protein SAMN05880556_11319 [Azospirillum sp. RU38E]SNT00821.1 hypothetical protein SAMN05880591_11318 [Azospirillum sp. RU37A]
MSVVTLKVADLRASLPALEKLRNQPKASPRLGFKMARNLRELGAHIETLQQQERAILTDTAELDEKGDFVFSDEAKTNISLKDPQTYAAKMLELVNIDLDAHLSLLSEEDLASVTVLSVQDYLTLDYLLEKPAEA